jgi:hypothetical protein
MTQQCKHDEQLLDFVYGELSDAERKIFADHLPGCGACSAQVEGFGQVRKEFQQRPPIEPVGESMQRMTALLMQAAAAAAPAGGRTAVASDGGKVLAFRSRGLRRILFHPAGGVMAVAAAALFWVVFRAQPGPQTELPAPSSTSSIGSPAGSSPTAATTAPVVEPVAKNLLPGPGDKAAPAEAVAQGLNSRGLLAEHQDGKAGVGSGDADFDGLRGKAQAAKDVSSLGLRSPLAEKTAEPLAPSQQVAAVDKPMAPIMAATKTLAPLDSGGSFSGSAAGGKGGTRVRAGDAQYRQANSGPAVVALADQAYAKSAKKEAGRESERSPDRWAQPAAEAAPPPPPQAAPAAPPAAARSSVEEEDGSVRRAIARTQEQRKQKVVDELANQELGGLNNGAPAGAPAAPANEGRYAQNAPSAGSSYKADTGASNYGNRAGAGDDVVAQSATPAMPANSMQQGRGVSTGNLPDDAESGLSTVKEQLRRGQCSEASALLTKLERSHPATRGLAETRAEWQSACAAPAQQLLERRLHSESPEPAAQAAPYRASKMRMASPAPMPPKKAAAKAAKPVDRGAAKAADVAY